MATWSAEDLDFERRIARMERRGRRIGLVTVELALILAIVGLWAWAFTAWPVLDYWVFPSVLPPYIVPAALAAVGLWLVLRKWIGAAVATLVLGAVIVLSGIGLGLIPPASGGQVGSCRSVFANFGLHGDDREDCFDARASRADDVAFVLSIGILVTAAGTALAALPGSAGSVASAALPGSAAPGAPAGSVKDPAFP